MSKVEMMSAKGKKKGALVPHLRFPEFRDAGEWEEKALKAVCSMQAGKFVAASDIFVCYNDNLYPCYGGNGLRGYTATYTHSGKFPLIGRQGALCGNVKMGNGQFHATEHAVVVSPIFDIQVNFLFYLLNLLNLNRFATGQAQPGLSVDVIGNISAPLPAERSEQKRIADCLLSLDERITAETNKLNALKAHKNGLLKQLFPAEGETLPALRFPAFRDAGEWEKKTLGDICEKIMDGTHFSPKSKCGPFLYLTSKNIQNGALDLSNTSNISEEEHRQIFAKCPVKMKDILLTKDGANTGNCALNNLSVEFSLLSSVAVLRGKQASIIQEFLFHTIGSPFIQKIIQESISGQAITRITLEKIGSYRIFLPTKPEQQRISDCLSSLDELITAQAQKIDLLKAHKKGLMQQLFPVLDEAKA